MISFTEKGTLCFSCKPGSFSSKIYVSNFVWQCNGIAMIMVCRAQWELSLYYSLLMTYYIQSSNRDCQILTNGGTGWGVQLKPALIRLIRVAQGYQTLRTKLGSDQTSWSCARGHQTQIRQREQTYLFN